MWIYVSLFFFGFPWLLKSLVFVSFDKLGKFSFLKEILFIFQLKNNCFTELCWFLPNINMNQPWVYMCPLPIPTLLVVAEPQANLANFHSLFLEVILVIFILLLRLQTQMVHLFFFFYSPSDPWGSVHFSQSVFFSCLDWIISIFCLPVYWFLCSFILLLSQSNELFP